VFYGVEEVGEAPCRFSGCDLGHLDQIIRLLEARGGRRPLPGALGAGVLGQGRDVLDLRRSGMVGLVSAHGTTSAT
jgi:hypothetical protein